LACRIRRYDIFKAEGALSVWQDPVNLGYPINTPANDIYFTVNEVDNDGILPPTVNQPMPSPTPPAAMTSFSNEWQDFTPKTQIDTLWVADSLDYSFLSHKILPINLYFHNDEPDSKTMAPPPTKTINNPR
jgi:hypothetical protein